MSIKINHQNKVFFLLAGTLLLLILSYFYAIKPSIDLYGENKKLQQKLSRVSTAPQQVKKYKGEIKSLNNQLGYVNKSGELSQDKILALIENFCREKNTYLTEYTQSILNTEKVYDIETNKIEITGTYNDIVKLIYEIEYKKGISKINSVQFEKRKEIKTKQNKLVATIYLQNINLK